MKKILSFMICLVFIFTSIVLPSFAEIKNTNTIDLSKIPKDRMLRNEALESYNLSLPKVALEAMERGVEPGWIWIKTRGWVIIRK